MIDAGGVQFGFFHKLAILHLTQHLTPANAPRQIPVPLGWGAPTAMAKAKKKSTARAKSHSKPSNENEPGTVRKRPTRPVWQGNLRLSLVSCPVALFNATTRSHDISFHLLNPETNNRIRMIPTDP